MLWIEVQQIINSPSDHIHRTAFLPFCIEVQNVHYPLQTWSDSPEAQVNIMDDSLINRFVSLLELCDGKLSVYFFGYRSQPHRNDRLIERTRRWEKYLAHHVSFGTREKECGIRTALDMGTKSSLHVFVGILGDLLELVDGHQTRLVGSSQITKYLVESRGRDRTVSESDSPYRIAINVEWNLLLKTFQCRNKLFPCFASKWFKFFYDSLTKDIHKVS